MNEVRYEGFSEINEAVNYITVNLCFTCIFSLNVFDYSAPLLVLFLAVGITHATLPADKFIGRRTNFANGHISPPSRDFWEM